MAHRAHIDDLIVGTRGRGFQPRQNQQVVDQALHALGLLLHETEIALDISHGHAAVLQGLEEAAQHGQRGAQFVRHVGHEMAAHLLQTEQMGDVTADHELLTCAKRDDLHLDDVPAGEILQDQRFMVIAAVQIGRQRGMAHEMHKPHADIAVDIQTKQPGGLRVAPFDQVVLRQHDHGIRHRRGGRLQARKKTTDQVLVAGLGAVDATNLAHHLVPQAAQLRHGVRPGRKPPMQEAQLVQPPDEQQRERRGGAGPGPPKEAADAKARATGDHDPPQFAPDPGARARCHRKIGSPRHGPFE